jgi:uncharacterized membrane protein
MEELLRQLSGAVALAIEAIAVLIVGWGSIEAAVAIARITIGGQGTHGARKAAWRRFGTWLLLGLEFELAADIVQTVISPGWADIGELGAIAVIRTFLNYFLEKDLREAAAAASVGERAGQPDAPANQRIARFVHGGSE